MSENDKKNQETSGEGLKLNGLYVFKVGMSSVYSESGEAIPVTVLKYEPMVVSQVKTQEKDGYQSLQLACRSQKASRSSKADKGHFSASGFENGAFLAREIRQDIPQDAKVGQKVSIESLVKGDRVKLTSKSKGRGFAGVMKRWDFAGGPASHGSGFHRRPGSIGNRTWPGRVKPGMRMSGHFGDETVTIHNVEVVEVLPSENVVMVKGGVPGARNSLVRLIKETAN